MQNNALKQSVETKAKEENKRLLLEDIQNLIKEKRNLQSRGTGSIGGLGNSFYNTNLNWYWTLIRI